jgi:hypothetical protein
MALPSPSPIYMPGDTPTGVRYVATESPRLLGATGNLIHYHVHTDTHLGNILARRAD